MKKRKFTFIQNGNTEIWNGEDIIDNANYIIQTMDCYNDDEVYNNYMLKYNEQDLKSAIDIINNSLVDFELDEIV